MLWCSDVKVCTGNLHVLDTKQYLDIVVNSSQWRLFTFLWGFLSHFAGLLAVKLIALKPTTTVLIHYYITRCKLVMQLLLIRYTFWILGFSCGSAGKESSCNAGDLGSIPGLGRSLGESKTYPSHYSGLENSMDFIVHGVAKGQTWLNDFHFHFLSWILDLKLNSLEKETEYETFILEVWSVIVM